MLRLWRDLADLRPWLDSTSLRPYYEQEGITIYHADCREVLPAFVYDSVDLVIADPPYNLGRAYVRSDRRRRG